MSETIQSTPCGFPALKEINALTLAALPWKRICELHLAWAKAQKRVTGSGFHRGHVPDANMPAWDEHGLNAIGIRMNDTLKMYTRREGFNDFLVLSFEGNDTVVLPCTTDPADTDVNSRGDAHLAEGAYNSYVRGFHKSDPERLALVQRKAPVCIVRTDSKGKASSYTYENAGINIHNAVGVNKPSAGCTVIEPEGGVGLAHDRNYQKFHRMLSASPDRTSRTYWLINHVQLAAYLTEIAGASQDAADVKA